MKIYLDWSVITHMKQGHLEEFRNALSSLDNIEILYSTSHISDLLVSYDGSEEHQKWINADLAYLSDLTQSNCLYIENGNVVNGTYSPCDLFDQRVSDLILKNQSDNWLDATLKNFEPGSSYHNTFLKMKELPMPEVIIEALKNPNTSEQFNKWYAGLTPESSLGDLVNVGMEKFRSLMQSDEYAELRNLVQENLKISGNMIKWEEPFKEIAKLYSQDNFRNINKSDVKHSPAWFQEIYNNYLILDMHGFHEDKISTSGKRKETMRNIVDDCFHAAFASLCEVYITNDRRAIFKTKEVYKHLGIKTDVFNTQEFIDLYKSFQSIPKTESAMPQIDLSILDKTSDVIKKVHELGNDTATIKEIVDYIELNNNLLLQFGTAINSLLTNQQYGLELATLNLDSMKKLGENIDNLDKCIEAHSTHLGAHDKHLAALGERLDIHGQHLSLHDSQLNAIVSKLG